MEQEMHDEAESPTEADERTEQEADEVATLAGAPASAADVEAARAVQAPEPPVGLSDAEQAQADTEAAAARENEPEPGAPASPEDVAQARNAR